MWITWPCHNISQQISKDRFNKAQKLFFFSIVKSLQPIEQVCKFGFLHKREYGSEPFALLLLRKFQFYFIQYKD